MDPIGASCFNLNVEENARAILAEKKQDDKFQELIVSCRSLSYYEEKKAKTLLPQILAATFAASFHVVVGLSLAYSAILIPQLESKDSPDFKITSSQSSWLASLIVLAVPVGAPIGGVLMDTIGRLNTIKLASIPGVIGWILIAASYNLPMLLIGRVFTGLAAALGTGPAIVYLTEIARADMRGSLISMAPAYTSLGMVLAYLKGWAVGWRNVAWISIAYSIVPAILVMFIPESAIWLVSKDRNDEALKSLNWINKYQPQPPNKSESLSDMQLAVLQKEHQKKVMAEAASSGGVLSKAKNFLKPTGYKPLLVLIGLFVFQQFSGIYITLFYSISFFNEIGSEVNPYLASVMLGSLRCLMSVVNTYMMRTFRRRPLIFWSSFGMTVCMIVSGLFSKWIKDGTTTQNWVPVAAIGMYIVMSMIGLLSIPWTMTAELFPIEIRGIAHSIINGLANLIMFAAIQSYMGLKDFLGGIANIQFFFAGISVAAIAYAFVFLPETHGLKLIEIEEYFKHNMVYLGQKKLTVNNNNKNNNNASRATQKDIIKSNGGQNEKLLNA